MRLSVVVTTYNPFDAFAVEKDLYDVLGMFDAEKTVEENLDMFTRMRNGEFADGAGGVEEATDVVNRTGLKVSTRLEVTGVQRLTASVGEVEGSPVTFTATATGAASGVSRQVPRCT